MKKKLYIFLCVCLVFFVRNNRSAEIVHALGRLHAEFVQLTQTLQDRNEVRGVVRGQASTLDTPTQKVTMFDRPQNVSNDVKASWYLAVLQNLIDETTPLDLYDRILRGISSQGKNEIIFVAEAQQFCRNNETLPKGLSAQLKEKSRELMSRYPEVRDPIFGELEDKVRELARADEQTFVKKYEEAKKILQIVRSKEYRGFVVDERGKEMKEVKQLAERIKNLKAAPKE